jgi:uncharacterized protein (TIGR00251 family)
LLKERFMDAPALQQTPDGVLLPVQAQPRSRKNMLAGWHAGRLKVCVTQAPEKGKANQAIIKLLVKTLDLRRSQVELVSGETSPQKLFCVEGLTAEELSSRIALALGDAESQ